MVISVLSELIFEIKDIWVKFSYWSTVEDMVLKVCTRVGQDRRCSSV
jgi:hypothetical protein